MDVRFKTPANFLICGQSQSGKSHLVRSMLHHLEDLFHPVPTRVIYCYGEYQKEFEEMSNVELIEGFPNDLYALTNGHENSLIVLDDLMTQCSNDERVSDLFTRGPHHRGISVLYLTQNLFPPGKLSRTISLNSHYMLIFRNPHDSLGITTLAKQMFPKHGHYLLESYHDATSKPYGYLMIDCHQLTPENMHLRTTEHFARGKTNCQREAYLRYRALSKVIICKMSKRMKGSLPYLQVIVKSKPKLRKLLINNIPEEVITAICECSLNLLK